MKPKRRRSDAPPDPAEYGPKADLSLGTDLLEWLDRRIKAAHYQGPQLPNLLVRLGLPTWTAEGYAASTNPFVAAVGRALLTGLKGNVKEAGRLYRIVDADQVRQRRRNRALAAAAARSSKTNKMAIEELDVAIEILDQRPGWISIASLAKLVARRLRRKPESVRGRLKSVKYKRTPK